mgnify:CR=1 FL=1
MERRLAAVLISDVVGYTKLMEEDTEGTVAAWSDGRDKVIKPSVASKDGRIVKFTGDGFLAEFSTVQAALECGIEMQNKLSDNPLEFRMAINLGDIIDDGEDIHGEGINIAARLEGIAEPGGICISGDVYNQVRNRITAEYEDLGPQEVKNVAEPVQAYAVRFKNTTGVSDKGGASPQTEKPSIAVLPFDNMSGDPEQEYFSDGITEDIITALSHLKWLNVIARNSSFTYKGQSPDIRTVSEELNVRYVLEGSIRRAGNRVRINAQLLEGETGNHIWAEKYDRELKDIFEVQDEITKTVILEIRPAIEKVELQRIQSKAPENLDAWDYYQKGRAALYSEAGVNKAEEFYELAENSDPNFVDAVAMRCLCKAVAGFLLNKEFDVDVGYSDHTLGVEVSIAAVTLGASCIEKHFTLDRNLHGPDHRASLEPNELKTLIEGIRNIELSFGSGIKRPASSELNNREIIRKSVYLRNNKNAGDVINESDLISLRPSGGISPNEIHKIVGRQLARTMAQGTVLTWADFA